MLSTLGQASAAAGFLPSPRVNLRGRDVIMCCQPHVIAELDAAGTALVSAPVALFHNNEAWEGGVTEAPWVIKAGSYYYIFYSGACSESVAAGDVLLVTPCSSSSGDHAILFSCSFHHRPPAVGGRTLITAQNVLDSELRWWACDTGYRVEFSSCCPHPR